MAANKIIKEYANESLEINSRFLWTSKSTQKRFDISKYINLNDIPVSEIYRFFNNLNSNIMINLFANTKKRENIIPEVKKIIRDSNEFAQITGHNPLQLSWGLLTGSTEAKTVIRTPFLLTHIKAEIVRNKTLRLTNIGDVVSPNVIAICKILKDANSAETLINSEKNYDNVLTVIEYYKKFMDIKNPDFINNKIEKIESLIKEKYNPQNIYKLKENEYYIQPTLMLVNISSALNFVYENNIELLHKNPNTLPFIDIEKSAPDSIELSELNEKINNQDFYNKVHRITPINISQEQTIFKALENNVSVEGPPGTGKTETITNLIANIIANKKCAYVTSEKYAALDVLKRKTKPITNAIFILTNDQDIKAATHDLCKKILEIDKYYELLRNTKLNNYIENIYFESFYNIQKQYKNNIKDIDELLKDYNYDYYKLFASENPAKEIKNITNKKLVKIWNKKYRKISKKYKDILKQKDAYKNMFAKNEESKKIDENKYIDEANNIISHHYKHFLINKYYDDEKFKRKYKQLTQECKHQLTLKYKVKPLKIFIAKYWDIIVDIIPIWIMPIDLICKYFPLNIGQFDYGIFDESSQIYTCRALPVVNRAKKIAVFGDSKQMGPSDNFTTRFMDLNDESIDDDSALKYKSLFDWAHSNCYTSSLDFHYRSKNAKLIEFSNMNFYDNHLEILKRPKEDDIPIKVINVAGKWLDNTNIVEAQKTVEIIKKYQTSFPRLSLGVVTFNFQQKELINDLIEKDTALKTKINKNNVSYHNNIGKEEPLIVRNIENIQGDERDIIIFSVTYAKRPNGSLVTYFGSLSQKGGENRLNVALTRARKTIIVVKSVYGKDYKLKTQSIGSNMLVSWLNYLDNLNQVPPEHDYIVKKTDYQFNYFEKLFADGFAKYFKGINYVLDSHIEIGKYAGKTYYINFGLRNLKNQIYDLGIELDEKHFGFHSLGDSKKINIDRQQFMEVLGWKILKISYLEYIDDPQKCWTKIYDYLHNKLNTKRKTKYEYNIEDDVPQETSLIQKK